MTYTLLYSTLLCYTLLYSTLLYYTILYYTIPYYTILFYTKLSARRDSRPPGEDVSEEGRALEYDIILFNIIYFDMI